MSLMVRSNVRSGSGACGKASKQNAQKSLAKKKQLYRIQSSNKKMLEMKAILATTSTSSMKGAKMKTLVILMKQTAHH